MRDTWREERRVKGGVRDEGRLRGLCEGSGKRGKILRGKLDWMRGSD